MTLKKQRHISVASQPTQCEIGNRYEFLQYGTSKPALRLVEFNAQIADTIVVTTYGSRGETSGGVPIVG